MDCLKDVIKKRRSVRTYDGMILDEQIKEQLLAYADDRYGNCNVSF
jgi:nitroreductase